MVCLYPWSQFEKNYQTGISFLPFSETLIWNVLRRVLLRKEHQTVTGDDIEKALLVLNFMNLYSGTKSIKGKNFRDRDTISDFVAVKFHQEADLSLMP